MGSPLTAEDKKKLDTALAVIADAEKDIVKARLAGIDISEQEARLKDLKTRLSQIRSAYFPAGK